MTEGRQGQPKDIDHRESGQQQWEAQALGELLAREGAVGQIFVLKALQPSHLFRDAPELRRVLSQQGLPLFILDPTGTGGAGEKFLDVLNAYVQEAEQRGKLSEKARHLFEFVSSSSDQSQSGLFPAAGGNLYSDTLCRLWTSLSKELPAVLLVVNAQHCPPSELKTLEHLSSFFFADPIEKLTPELGAIEEGQGRLVFLDGADFPIDLSNAPTKVIDLSEAAEESVREFLADPQVVRRFIDSTGGDPRRLGELVESLPQDVQNFWLFRYDRLAPLEKTLLNVLAVAGEPLLVDTLHGAMSLLKASEFFGRSLRQLTELGFVERKISAGSVRVHIESREFARAVVESLDDQARRDIHQALAEAELSSNSSTEPSPAFLARHYLAAGDIAAGFEYGKRATTLLIARRAYDQAQELLESLLEFAEETDELREVHAQLLEVHAALGNPHKALSHCAKLESFVEDTATVARLHCQSGQLLIRIGEYDRAIERFTSAGELTAQQSDLREIWIEAKRGEGEAMFSKGRHQAAEERAVEVIEQIEDARRQDGRDRGHLDMSLLHARNLIGKVTVLRGECKKGRSLFEKNRALATEWGWDDEIARAEANLGLVCLQEKDFGQALERLERARTIARSPAAIPRAYVFLNMGIVHQRKGRYEEALRHYLESLRASRQEGEDASYGLAAYNLVTLYQDIGAFDRALSIVEHLDERQDGDKQNRFVGNLPTAVLGSILLDQRQYEEALDVFGRLTDTEDESSASSLPVREALLRSVEAHLALGQTKVAERIIEEFELPEDDDEQPQLSALYDLARASVALNDGETELALRVGREATERARGAGHMRDALRISFVVASALHQEDRSEEARALLERELIELKDRAREIPQAHRPDFFAVPLHQDLVELVRELKGEIPEEFDVVSDEPDASEEPAPVATDDPAFIRWRSRYKDIIGEDPRLHQIFRVIDRVADSDSPVLLQGESGTGKELMAEAIHTHSERLDGSLVKVNCAAFVEDLLLSELFGHVKGAFTGAVSDKMGRFERADGGTIFLDEIGDISPKTQVALLRVLQEGTFEKVGGAETQSVDVRVVCATNKNLEEMVKSGDFRLDLYYRLKGVVMEMPPLDERRQDIPRLVAHFVRAYSGGQKPKKVSRDVLKFLASYSWPGNVRELQNFVKSILLFVEGDTVEMSHVHEFSEFFADGEVDLELPEIDYEVELEDYEEPGETFEDPEEALVDQIIAEGLSLASIKKRLELESIRRALIETGGNITRAAEILQMKRPRLSQIVNSTDELLALKNELVG